MNLILASGSPQRRQLLASAGYLFTVVPPRESAECGLCSQETAPELVARLAYQKAKDVACRTSHGIVIGCDTVAECKGQILGKPHDCLHARQMLKLLQGCRHRVYSGLCLWCRPDDRIDVQVDSTILRMESLTDEVIENYLDSDAWQGKAGGFGLQDRPDWLTVIEGSETNVIGLPMERLERMLKEDVESKESDRKPT